MTSYLYKKLISKNNPNHDELGRFASSDSSGADDWQNMPPMSDEEFEAMLNESLGVEYASEPQRIPPPRSEDPAIAHVEDTLSQKYPNTDFYLTGIDSKTAPEIGDHIDQLFQQYPEAAATVPYVGTGHYAPEGYEPEWGGYGGEVLAQTISDPSSPKAYTPLLLNPEYFGFPKDSQEVLDKAKEKNWFTDYTLKGTITHEFGHIINFHLEKSGGDSSHSVKKFMEDNKEAGDHVSGYAKHGGPIEAFAEAFTSIHHNSPKDQAPYTKKLKSFLDGIKTHSKIFARDKTMDKNIQRLVSPTPKLWREGPQLPPDAFELFKKLKQQREEQAMKDKTEPKKSRPSLKRESKAFAFQLKDFDDAQGRVSGYLSTFDNVDEGDDRVRPGAFKRTLQNKYEYKKKNNKQYLMPLLWQHKDYEPIGGYIEAREDNIGLYVELEVDLDVQRGKEAYSGLKKGYIFQQSMGYDAIQSEYVKINGKMVRDLTEVRLWEGSIVTFPMNEEAVVTDVKSASGRHMDRKDKEKKTVQEHYAEEMAQDLLEDWSDVFLSSLTCAILDAFKIGDQPEQDITEALDDFKELVLTKFVPEAIECDLSGYIADHSDTYSSADYAMQYGSDSQPNYGWMSSNRRRSEKLGKPISSTNQQNIDAHVKSIKALAKSAKAAMQDHANAMHDTADTVADLASGNSKSGRAISAATAQSLNSAADAMHDHADKALDIMKEHTKAVRTAADDFANTMQGAEKPYAGDDSGNPDDGQQEGKSNPATPSRNEARSPQSHSQKSTADEDERELELALASLLQELR